MKSQILLGVFIGWCCAIVMAIILSLSLPDETNSSNTANKVDLDNSPGLDTSLWQHSIDEAKIDSRYSLQSGESLESVLSNLERRARMRGQVTAKEIEAGVAAINYAGGTTEDVHTFTGKMLALQNQFNNRNIHREYEHIMQDQSALAIEKAIFALGIIDNSEEFTQLVRSIHRQITRMPQHEHEGLSSQLLQALKSHRRFTSDIVDNEVSSHPEFQPILVSDL